MNKNNILFLFLFLFLYFNQYLNINLYAESPNLIPNQKSFWSKGQNKFFSALGIIALGTLGYTGYTSYQNNKTYQIKKNEIKKYLIKCMQKENTEIIQYWKNNLVLLNEYKKIIQEKIKNDKKNWLNYVTLMAAIGATISLAMLYWQNVYANKNYYTTYCKPNNIFIDNSTNTTNNYTINNLKIEEKYTYDDLIKIKMTAFAKRLFIIISNTAYFKDHYNTFLLYLNYLENDCPYVNTTDIESFFIEIILEIITDKLKFEIKPGTIDQNYFFNKKYNFSIDK